ncbi:hypothetical protein MJO28_002651 [Puccinia striiformis f. sp. tritici]|uniref:Uncharacterized protein n=1 Tax=Puccinia striiformis f. sp. tritici TaxID=168172 RepID=A0ACC0ESL9_9BASI|nr:hypothetical protein Pst134EB_006471 [Puccinia striiformis f. sp. tritici]KAI7958860.1 hypothetical protein MJO28_002651 [Puccinia striiformis f. sp. tritici]KAI7964624.1 hypothetical protein MJO29_002722 [Puccinia striiformis f. sp. tritici]
MQRINASQHEHPNPYINFVRVLGDQPADKLCRNKNFSNAESARLIMRAIAAQVVPLMKTHGMGLNSFNEYEWNSEFAGRNWNGGEIIELVLRRKDGSFLPMGYLLTVMAHELAHIHHMNHGPHFQKLNLQLRKEIQQLQQKGYYGPGFWSSGQRLRDSAVLHGDAALHASDLPEYTCGGSQRQGTKRRIYRPKTVTKRKADRFVGEGQKLEVDGPSSFRKRANAAAAKNARALAAEKRIQASKASQASSKEGSVVEDDEQVEFISLEDEWEDYEPQVPKSALESENEKGSLRNEMKTILADFKNFQPTQSPISSRNKTPIVDRREKKQIQQSTSDDDEIEIIEGPSSSIAAGKKKASSFQTSWKCLICYEDNHVDLACCGSCLRAKGTPAPKWD